MATPTGLTRTITHDLRGISGGSVTLHPEPGITKASIRILAAVLTLFALTNPARSGEVMENLLGMQFVWIPAGEFAMGT
jgi:hypothetical protein